MIQYLFRFQISKIRCDSHWVFLIEIESNLAILTCQTKYPPNTNIYLVIIVPMTNNWQFYGSTFKGRDYGMVATSFGSFDILFKFQCDRTRSQWHISHVNTISFQGLGFCFKPLSTFFVQTVEFMLSLFVSGCNDCLEKTCEFKQEILFVCYVEQVGSK